MYTNKINKRSVNKILRIDCEYFQLALYSYMYIASLSRAFSELSQPQSIEECGVFENWFPQVTLETQINSSRKKLSSPKFIDLLYRIFEQFYRVSIGKNCTSTSKIEIFVNIMTSRKCLLIFFFQPLLIAHKLQDHFFHFFSTFFWGGDFTFWKYSPFY